MAVIIREYNEVVKKKSFLVGTILTPVFMLAIIFLPALFVDRETKDPIEFTLVDEESGHLDEFKRAFTGTLPDGQDMFIVNYISVTEEQADSVKSELNKAVESENLDFYVFVPEHFLESGYAERYAKKRGKFIEEETVRERLSSVLQEQRLSEYNVPPQQVGYLTGRVNLDYQQVGPRGSKQDTADFLTQYLSGLAFVMILFSVIVGYGQHLMRAVLEEKNSRIIEVLVSSLSPFQLMMGKILGLGAASITQMVLWVVLGVVFAFIGSSSQFVADIIANARGLSVSFFLSFVAFFILGYFLFATLFATIGSIANSEKELQNLIGPIMMILVIPIVLAIAIAQNPDATWVRIMSFFPFLTPMMMIMRASFTYIPPFEILAAIGWLLIWIIVLGWVASKIFRVGILMYGKRPTVPEMIRWIRYR